MKYRELHQLVHALSRAEKRYFKIQAQTKPGPGEKSYLYLFDLLNAQKTYDPGAIHQQFMDSGYGKHFSWARNNLFRLLLRSMRSFHEAKDYRHELSGLVNDIRFLFNRRIYEKGEQLIRKGLKLARKYDEPLQELQLLSYSRGRLLNGLRRGYSDEMMAVLSSEAAAMETYQLRLELAGIYSRLALITRQSLRPGIPEIRDQFEMLVAEKHQTCHQHNSFFVRHFASLIAATYLLLVGDYEASHQHFETLLALWDAHPYMVPVNHSLYQKVINNFLTGCQLTERFQRYPAVLPKMNPEFAETFDEEGEIFQNRVHHHLIFYLNTDRLEEAVAMVPEIEEGMRKYGNKINPARQLALVLNISTAFFLLERFGECGKWIRKILNWETSAVRQDLRQYGLLMRLMVVFEQGEFEYLESLVHATREYFRRREGTFPFARFLIRCIHRLAVSRDLTEQDRIFHKNAKELRALSLSDPAITKANGYAELGYWLESHISGLPIREVMKVKRILHCEGDG